MDGIHDMGGMMGFGAVTREADEPLFHDDWERVAFGILLQASGHVGFSDDHLRAHIERIPPLAYLQASYYERWTRALESFLEERGLLTPGAIEARVEKMVAPARPDGGRATTLDDIEEAVARGASTRRDDAGTAPRFRPGDRVRVLNEHPCYHTRAPRYTRGRTGEIVSDHGVFVYPDTNARDLGECPEHCYTVAFRARELWGVEAPVSDIVNVDLYDSYLEAVETPA
ncbi:MAG: nitrile hydratase subunit beta [bacterium]|nr:nitrile hydratase subunit beta [bacterium]